jgi:serine protease Do
MRFAIFMSLCAMFSSAQTPRAVMVGGSYIGVGMQEHEAGGVTITVVEQDSPADKAGLKTGDMVLRYNGQAVESNEQFAHLVRETPAGRDVKIDISRGGAAQTVTVRVAQRKAPKADAPMGAFPFDIHLPDVPRSLMTLRSAALGVEAEAVDGQLAQYFGVKEGVLVRSVVKGSAAEKAGIRAGDTILKIDDAHVATPAEIAAQLRTLRGKSVAIALMRERKEVTVTATIGEDDPPGRIQITPFEVHPKQPQPNQP